MKKINFALGLLSATLSFSALAEEATCSVTDGVGEPTSKVLKPRGSEEEATMSVKVEGAFKLEVTLGRRSVDDKYVLSAAYISKATNKRDGKTVLMTTLSDTLPMHATLGYMENDVKGEAVGKDNNLMVIDCKSN